MNPLLRDAGVVLGNDLRIEARSRVLVSQVAPFVLAVVMLFGFALDADSVTLRRTSSGVFWVVVVLAAVLVAQRSAAVERSDGLADALRLTGMSPAGMFVGRATSLALEMWAVEAVLAVAMVALFDLSPKGLGLVAVTMLAATIAIAAAGAIYGPLAGGLRTRETILPLLLVPALAPVLLGATRAFESAQGRGVGSGWAWAGMLGIMAVVYVTFGMAVWGPLLEET